MQGPEDGESHQHNGLEPLAEVEGALLVVEVLHLPHPELGGLLRGGEHYLKRTKNESAAAGQHKHHAENMNNGLQASPRLASPRPLRPMRPARQLHSILGATPSLSSFYSSAKPAATTQHQPREQDVQLHELCTLITMFSAHRLFLVKLRYSVPSICNTEFDCPRGESRGSRKQLDCIFGRNLKIRKGFF